MQIKASSRKAMRKNTSVPSDRKKKILDKGNKHPRVHHDKSARKGKILLVRTTICKHFRKKCKNIN